MADELTPAEIEAARLLEEEKFNTELVKRFGTTDLMKKSDQIKVLTPEEQKAENEKRENEILKFGLENNYTSAKEQEEYIGATKGDKVDLARKKFIAKNPELKDAGKVFDRLAKVEEDDEITDPKDQEKLIPNEDKKAALAWVNQIADEDIDTRFSRIKSLPKKFEQYQEQEKLKAANIELIKKAHAAIPRRFEDEVEGIKFGIDFSDDDIKAAYSLVEPEIIRKGLTEDEVKNTMATFLFAKNAKKYAAEGIRLAYEKGRDDEKRGAKGLLEKDKTGSGGISKKREYLAKEGMVGAAGT